MKLAFAAAAIAALAITAPASAASDRMQLAQADVNVRIGDHHGERHRHFDRREVRMHRDEGRHEGWRRGHHGKRVVIIKKHGPGRTVIKKRVSHRD